MTRPVKRQSPRKIVGRRNGPTPESSQLHDERLMPGVAINGAEPMVSEGDEWTSLVQVRCHCGSVIAVAWNCDRRARTGLPDFLVFEAQILEDMTVRPVVSRTVENLLTPAAMLKADCPAHGRHTLGGAALVNAARGAAARVARGHEQMVKFVVPGAP